MNVNPVTNQTSTVINTGEATSQSEQPESILYQVIRAIQALQNVTADLVHIYSDNFKGYARLSEQFQELANTLEAAWSGMDVEDHKKLNELLSSEQFHELEPLTNAFNLKIDGHSICDENYQYDKGQIKEIQSLLSYQSQQFVNSQTMAQTGLGQAGQSYNNDQTMISTLISQIQSLLSAIVKATT